MAKKVLTPEEVKAKMEKKSAKRKLFFGTFTKALAFFLAIAMAYSLATIAFTPATTTVASGTVQSGDATGGASTDSDDDMFSSESSTPSGSESSTPSGSESSTPSGSESSTSGQQSSTSGQQSSTSGQQTTSVSKADAAKALNDATAKAAKASYHWKRVAEYTKDIALDPSWATGIVDGIITTVDPNANLNTVVGGFLDIGTKEADVANGTAPEGMKEKYLIKAMSITADDIASYKVEGNTYMIQIKNTQNPDVGSALDHATNDYITVNEVNTNIASAVGDAISAKDSSQLNYSSIAIVAVIEDGKLTNMKVSYNFSATLDLSIGASGSGAGKGTAEYSNFKY